MPNLTEAPTTPVATDVIQPPSRDGFTSFLEDVKEQTFDYSKARIQLNRLVDSWDAERKITESNRLKRDIEVDVEALRQSGQLDEDETLIPDRVIDTNIQRELPPFVNYLKNSRRLAIFTCVSNPDITDTQKLELEFTRVNTYPDWEKAHFKELDGSRLHGWDAIEVVYDETKPGNAALEHIGHDRLYFPRTCLNIQDAPIVIRCYDVTVLQLKKFVQNNGFSQEQVGTILNARRNTDNQNETIEIYKVYSKCEGKVYSAWFCLKYGCNDWLKSPIPLYLGIKNKVKKTVPATVTNPMLPPSYQTVEVWEDAVTTEYPIYILNYRETEKPKIVDNKGRAFLDGNKQEAQTAILSSFVNGLYRATCLYAARGTDNGTGSSLSNEEDVIIQGNRVLNQPVQFFHPDYPDPMVLKALQYFDVANASETNQVTYAVNNRQDSRKTATEIESAQRDQGMLNSVQLTLFSSHIRNICNLLWLIIQSQALQGRIQFLLIKQQKPVLNPVTQQPVIDPTTMQPMMEEIWVNDIATISQVYDVRAAGDVDVIQKQEKLMQMKQDWPVISQTILKDVFLAEMLRLQYPDTGNKWADMLMTQGNQFEQMKGLLSGLSTIMAGAVKDNPNMLMTLPAEQQKQVNDMIQQGMMMGQTQTTA